MEVMFNLQIDCESTQSSVSDPALGKRSIKGVAKILERYELKGTFIVIPSDLKMHGGVYRELRDRGHEVGLHSHPAEQGWCEFLGVYGAEEQETILAEGIEVFEQVMEQAPRAFTPGYFSANDITFAVLEKLGFTHGSVSLPTRNLPACACIWGSSPDYCHYPHRNNRCLKGDVNFVDVPVTTDPDSRMWGGATPQDLRVELVDAKNHWYTIKKSLDRQIDQRLNPGPVYIKALTHNIFDYSDPRDFRTETLERIIQSSIGLSREYDAEMIGATTSEIACRYREITGGPRKVEELKLDTRGRQEHGA